MDKKKETTTTKAIRLSLQLKADAKGQLPATMEVARTGSWSTPWHGDFDITVEDLHEAVRHFDAGVYRVQGTEPLAGTLDHLGGETPAAFRINRIYVEGESLMAEITWTKLGEEKLERDEYRYVSFEFFPRSMPFQNPENAGETLVNVLTGATLTNDPLFKKLKPVMASAKAGASDNNQEGDSMDLAEIRAKAAADLTDDEKSFLVEHKAELTADELKTFGLEEAADDKDKSDDNADNADKDKADDADEDKADAKAAKVEASAKGGLSAADIKQLKADAQAGREAMQKLQLKEAQEFVAASVAKGRIKSESSDSAVELLLASSGKQRENLEKFINELPANPLLDGEMGSGEAHEGASAVDRVFAQAKELIDKGEHKTVGDASRAVLAADAQLAKRFAAEQESKQG